MIRIKTGISAEEMPAFREIFFLTSSRQRFSSAEEKERFFEKWTRYYLESEPDLIFLAKDENEKVLGYLTGCVRSGKMNDVDELFADQFSRFPAHLHINCHPDAQGKGCGSRLMAEFIRVLHERKIAGVHIVTSPIAENRRFYLKNGFNFELIRAWKERPLLFMGRDL